MELHIEERPVTKMPVANAGTASLKHQCLDVTGAMYSHTGTGDAPVGSPLCPNSGLNLFPNGAACHLGTHQHLSNLHHPEVRHACLPWAVG